jgi:hypothetical protein
MQDVHSGLLDFLDARLSSGAESFKLTMPDALTNKFLRCSQWPDFRNGDGKEQGRSVGTPALANEDQVR